MATTVSRRCSVVNRSRVAESTRVTVSRRLETIDTTHTVIALRGELDAAALNALVDTFDDAIAQDDSDVVVDLADVDFIGAAWIGTLVRGRAVLQLQRRELRLRAPSVVVYRLLELCGLAYLVEPIERADAPDADVALT